MKQKPVMWLAVCLMVACCLVLSCSDDDDTGPTDPGTSSSLTGHWRVVSGDEAIQFNFNSDKTLDRLYEADFGFRSFKSNVYLLIESQVMFDGNVYNYTISSDTLRLLDVDFSIVMVRDDTAPGLNDWIVALSTSTSFDPPLTSTVDIDWHGDRLWFGNAYSGDYLYQVDPVTGTVADSLPIGPSAFALCWAGDQLWVSSNGYSRLYLLDTISGTSSFYSLEMSSWIQGIAFDGEDLWAGSNNSRTIYRYNPTLDTIVDTFHVDRPIHGMTYHDGYIYACADGIINRIQISPFRVVAAFRIEGAHVEGITNDGTNFWMLATNDIVTFVTSASF